MGVRATMNDYLLWGAGAALLVLLLVVLLIQRRARPPRGRSERADRAPSRATSPRSRSASELDTVSDVHAFDPARPSSSDDVRLRAEREAAEQAARAEADREAAEWEARLIAQQLADEDRERARIAAEQAAAQFVAPEPAALGPAAKVDEQAAVDALAREAAEWEARLAAQQLDAENERQRAAAEAERAASEAAAERAAQQRADQQRAEQQAADLASLHFTLDPEPAPEPAPAPAPAPPCVVANRTPEQCLVMIADDSKVVRIKTSRLLAKHLYRVSLAEDGLDAARQIELDLPDVLITDVEMPGMDGFELTRQMRSNPRTAHIPIVMITADDVKHRADAFEAGVSVLLSKPYPEDQLLSYLQSTLNRAVPVP